MGGDESRGAGDEDVLGLICGHCDVKVIIISANRKSHGIKSNR